MFKWLKSKFVKQPPRLSERAVRWYGDDPRVADGWIEITRYADTYRRHMKPATGEVVEVRMGFDDLWQIKKGT